MYCPKVGGGGGGGTQTHLFPLPNFWKGAHEPPPPPPPHTHTHTHHPHRHHPISSTPVQPCHTCFFFLICMSSPNLFPLKLMADSSFWAFSTNSIYMYLNPIFAFARDVKFWFRFIFGWITSQSTIFQLYNYGTLMSRFTEEVGPTVGIPRHRYFLGFFNVPVQA